MEREFGEKDKRFPLSFVCEVTQVDLCTVCIIDRLSVSEGWDGKRNVSVCCYLFLLLDFKRENMKRGIMNEGKDDLRVGSGMMPGSSFFLSVVRSFFSSRTSSPLLSLSTWSYRASTKDREILLIRDLSVTFLSHSLILHRQSKKINCLQVSFLIKRKKWSWSCETKRRMREGRVRENYSGVISREAINTRTDCYFFPSFEVFWNCFQL